MEIRADEGGGGGAPRQMRKNELQGMRDQEEKFGDQPKILNSGVS